MMTEIEEIVVRAHIHYGCPAGATDMITKSIEQYVLKARIEELEKVQFDGSFTLKYLGRRIAQLKNELGEE